MHKCLDSLERQTVLPDEVIVCDDCSNDDSFKLLSDYAKHTKLNISVISNEVNSGPGVARMNAVKKATAEYIAFCDCDDWYELVYVEKVKDCIKKDNVDLVICDNYQTYDNYRIAEKVTGKIKNCSRNEILAFYPMSLCRFTVRRSIVLRTISAAIYNGEDAAVAAQIIALSNNIKIVDEPLYNYYIRKGSASNNPTKNAFKGMLTAFSVIEKALIDKYPEETEYLGIKLVCYAATLNAYKAGISHMEVKMFLNKFKQSYPSWFDNKYIGNLDKKKSVYVWAIKNNLLIFCKAYAVLHMYIINKL